METAASSLPSRDPRNLAPPADISQRVWDGAWSGRSSWEDLQRDQAASRSSLTADSMSPQSASSVVRLNLVLRVAWASCRQRFGPGKGWRRSFQPSMKPLMAVTSSGTLLRGAADGLAGDDPQEHFDQVQPPSDERSGTPTPRRKTTHADEPKGSQDAHSRCHEDLSGACRCH